MNILRCTGFITAHKKELAAMGIILLVLLLALWPSGDKNELMAVSAPANGTFDAAKEHEDLVATLSAIKDVGKVSVMITYASSSEEVPAYDRNVSISGNGQSNSQTESQSPAAMQGEVVVLRKDRPAVLGVIVVAQGASSISVRLSISQAVQTALGIPASKIEVFEMK